MNIRLNHRCDVLLPVALVVGVVASVEEWAAVQPTHHVRPTLIILISLLPPPEFVDVSLLCMCDALSMCELG